MIRINLLPVKAAQKKEKLIGQLIVAALVLILVGAGCFGAWWYVNGLVQEKQELIEAKRFEITKLMKTIGEVKQFEQRQKELRAKLDVLEQLKKARSGPVFLLDELYRALPDKVWLTKFKEGGGNVSISGIGSNEESVAVFMRDLEASEYYKNVELKVTQQNVQGGVKFQKFDITCRVEKTSQAIEVEAAGGKKARRSGGT